MKQRERTTRELLARAALYRWLARGFAYPEAGHAREMARAFARLDHALLGEILPPRLVKALARTGRAWRGRADAELAAEYVRLFLGGGPVMLHETAYGDARRIAGRTAELADIGGFYAAFGFTLSESDPDLPDHLCAELEFHSLLLVKQAYALARGWLSKAGLARAAARTFLEQHLGRWVGAFRSSLQEHHTGSYLDLADAVEALVEAECRRLRARPTAFTGRLPHDTMQEDSLTCPRAVHAAAR